MSNKGTNKKSKSNLTDMILISLFSGLICVCSFISIPSVIPFTLQLFAVYCALGILGGKNGTVSIIIYILLGIIGLPVFSGFKSGLGVITGPTGGFIIGFVFSGLVFWLVTAISKNKAVFTLLAMIVSLAVCYLLGTLWFVYIYGRGSEDVGFMGALSVCVVPFIVPDLIKIAAAFTVSTLVNRKLKIIKKKQ
ncbi:MAG: biotin transporter BioY [Ruminococcaceae bacterium]|nr:biotin transporter BioY [Oscillospiraceae bacterium]